MTYLPDCNADDLAVLANVFHHGGTCRRTKVILGRMNEAKLENLMTRAAVILVPRLCLC